MPTSNETRVINPVLQGFIESYMNDQTSYVFPTGRAFPILKTDEKTGTYFKWADTTFKGRGNAFPMGGDLARAYKGDYQKAPPRAVTTDTFSCVDYGERDFVDRTQEADTDSALNLRGGLTSALMSDVLIAAESRLTAILEATGTISQNTTLTGSDQWSDADNSNPVGVINTAVDTIRIATAGGLGATHDIVAITNPTVWNALRFHPDLAGAITSNRNSVFSTSDFMEFFGITDLMIPDCVANSNNVGQSVSGAYLWGDNFIVLARPKNPASTTHAAGYIFERDPIGVESERFSSRLDEILVSHRTDEKLVNVKDAYLIYDVLA